MQGYQCMLLTTNLHISESTIDYADEITTSVPQISTSAVIGNWQSFLTAILHCLVTPMLF